MRAVELSVCLITYNHAPYIEEAIKSVLSQKLTLNWELIISDDCSTDGTQEIVRKYADRHPDLIRPFLRTENLGTWVHIVHVLKEARGEFVGYLEGDDRYTDNLKLQTQIEYLRSHPDNVGCFHDLTVVDEAGGLVEESFLASQRSSFKSVLHQGDLLQPGGVIGQINSWVYRRSYIDSPPRWLTEFPLDKSLAFYLATFGSWGYIDKRMSLYRLHGGGIYSPRPRHFQNEMLLRHILILYGVAEYRKLYGRILQLRICHYCRELAQDYRKISYVKYVTYLARYLRHHPDKITAAKVLVKEEALGRSLQRRQPRTTDKLDD